MFWKKEGLTIETFVWHLSHDLFLIKSFGAFCLIVLLNRFLCKYTSPKCFSFQPSVACHIETSHFGLLYKKKWLVSIWNATLECNGLSPLKSYWIFSVVKNFKPERTSVQWIFRSLPLFPVENYSVMNLHLTYSYAPPKWCQL